jgi:hypothetical protein
MLTSMKIGVLIVGLAAIPYAGSAWAADVPQEHTGFQMAIRTGLAIPFGDLAKDAKLSDLSSIQVPLMLDIGGKVIPNLFLGGYLGLGFGGTGGIAADSCDAMRASCVSVGLRIGYRGAVSHPPG